MAQQQQEGDDHPKAAAKGAEKHFVSLIATNFSNTTEVTLPSLEDFDLFRHLCSMDVTKDGALGNEQVSLLTRPSDAYELIRAPLTIEATADNNSGAEGTTTTSGKEKTTFLYRLSLEDDQIDSKTMYRMLHDAQFRKKWDTYMNKGFNVAQITDYCDVGYYSFKIPMMTMRYSLAKRCWHEWSVNEYAIFNHSVKELPICEKVYEENKASEVKKAIKIVSYITGYYMKTDPETKKTKFVYITCSDIRSSIPKMVMNLAIKSNIPSFVKKLIQNCKDYPAFAEANPNTIDDKIFSGQKPCQKDSNEYKKHQDSLLNFLK
ncbi:MAG: hypothetical protein MHMPM18_001078 [Marteilia pararefringens]